MDRDYGSGEPSGASIALVFPGQGMQQVGMGSWLFRAVPDAAALLASLSEHAGVDLQRLCARGPADELSQTQYTQPAMFALGLCAFRYLAARGVAPEVMLGHSLGEITALCAAGAIDVEPAADLVVTRGRIMATAPGRGRMGRIVGLSRDDAQSCCDAAAADGRVIVAVQNAPDDHIVSGDEPAVGRCLELATADGAARGRLIATSHAFHSPLMTPIVPQWREVLGGVEIQRPSAGIVLNVSAEVTTDPGRIRWGIERQIDSPVEWWRSLCALASQGIHTVVACDTSRYLGRLARRAGLQVMSFADPRSLAGIVEGGEDHDRMAARL